MAENRAPQPVRLPSPNLYSVILWLAFLGMLLSLSYAVYQNQKLDRLSRDFNLLRQQSQKDISDLRDAQSASLEQDLLRIDQLSAQVDKTNQTLLDQATTLASRTRAELAKTVEQRHQEMIRAISDVRADLRADANAKASQPAKGFQQNLNPISQRDTKEVVAANSALAANSTTPTASVASTAVHEDDSPAPEPKKKHFWSKLNPFKQKKQQDSSSADGL